MCATMAAMNAHTAKSISATMPAKKSTTSPAKAATPLAKKPPFVMLPLSRNPRGP
jgi:hypothetical protein